MSKRGFIFVILFLLLVVKFSYALGNWKYYKPITIDNTQNSNTLTNYQVRITLDTASLIAAGKMKEDCSDIRITLDDGTTTLPYWIEDGTCNTANTVIWTKVPSILGSSTMEILVWYGNKDAESESDASSVFIREYPGLELLIDFKNNQINEETGKYDITLHGGPITYSTCMGGKPCAHFNNNAWITTNAKYPAQGSFCIVFNMDLLKNYQQLVGSTTGSDYGECWVYSTGDYRCRGEARFGTLGAGPWYSVCFDYDTSTADNSDRYFFNDGSGAVKKAPGEDADSYLDAAVGGDIFFLSDKPTGSYLFEGKVIYLMFFEQHKDDTEMLQLTNDIYNSHYDLVAGQNTLYTRLFYTPEPTTSVGEEVEIENSPPTINISGVENKTYFTSYFNITYNATDIEDSNFTLKAWLDNNLIYENEEYVNGNMLYYNTSLLREGQHNFTVLAIDSTGGATKEEVLFTVKVYEVVNISFNKYLYEDEEYNYTLSLRYNPYLFFPNMTYFIWNGTQKESNFTENGSYVNYTVTILNPLIKENNTLVGFKWEYGKNEEKIIDDSSFPGSSGTIEDNGYSTYFYIYLTFTDETGQLPIIPLCNFNVTLYYNGSYVVSKATAYNNPLFFITPFKFEYYGKYDKIVFTYTKQYCGFDGEYVKKKEIASNTTHIIWRSWLNDFSTFDGKYDYFEGSPITLLSYLDVVLTLQNFKDYGSFYDCNYSYVIKNATHYAYFYNKEKVNPNVKITRIISQAKPCAKFYKASYGFTFPTEEVEYFNNTISKTINVSVEYNVLGKNRGNITKVITLWHYDVEKCNNTYSRPLITFSLKKEEDFTQDNGQIRTLLKLYDSKQHRVEEDYFYDANVSQQRLCLYDYPDDAFSYLTGYYTKLFLEGETHYKNKDMTSERSYYLNNASYKGKEINIDLYTINLSSTDNFLVTFNVKDEFGNELEGAQVKILKLNESNNAYYTLTIVSTDVNGNAYAYLEVEKYYKFIIIYNGIVYYVSNPIQLYQNQYSFVIRLTEGGINPVMVLEGIDYDCKITKDEQTINCYVNDNTNKVVASRLVVWKRDMLIRKAVYDNTITTSTAYYNYTIQDNKTHEYKFYINIEGYGWFLAKQGVFNDYKRDPFEGRFILESMFIVLIMALLGVRNPQLAIIMTGIGFIIAYVLGFSSLSYSFIVASIILGIISLWRMRS